MTKINKLTKSLLAVLLTLCMLVFLMPAAWADDNVQAIGGGAETKEPIGVSVARLGTPRFTSIEHEDGRVYIYADYELGVDYDDFLEWQIAFTGVIVKDVTVSAGDYDWEVGRYGEWIWILDFYFDYGTNTVKLLASGYNEVIITCEILTISPPSDPVDKSDLSALVEAAARKVETDYTPISWASFATAFADAQAVSKNPDATQEQVNDAVSALQTAMEGLTTPIAPPPSEAVDKSGLSTLIEAAAGKVESDYTPASWAPFTAALTNAQAVSKNPDATQAEVEAAISALQTAMEGLTTLITSTPAADKSDLSALIAKAAGKAESDYTPASWADFTKALAKARAVSENPDATQAEVDNAAAALQTAMEGLTTLITPTPAADKSDLSALITVAAGKVETDYTPASWAPFATALAKARAVSENPDATQEQVDDAISALQTAMDGLRAANGGRKGDDGGGSGSPAAITPAVTVAEAETPLAEATGSQYFDDLAGDFAWAVAGIDFLYEKGVVNGIGERCFDPARAVSRGDCLLMLVRAFNLQAEVPDNFADVPAGSYYYESIGIAKALGIAKGDGENFRPHTPLTRQDIMTLIDRTLQVVNQALPAGDDSDLSAFADQNQIAGYARTAVATLVRAGVVNGSGGGVNPLGSTTRAELAVMLYRILNKQV